ncbi:MAG: GHMP family kinase ATP-binding protein [Promethearchaeota archaeon]
MSKNEKNDFSGGNKNKIQISAPGRVCLFGEHQDYLELAVIPSAIDLRCNIEGSFNNSERIEFFDKVYNERIIIPLNSEVKKNGFKLNKNDYFKAVINVFVKRKLLDTKEKVGFSGTLWNDVPQKSGLSSSAAVLVAFTKLIDQMFKLDMNKEEIGLFAYYAEHDELGIPCGQMDQLSSAVGDIFHMKCTNPPKITPIKNKIEGLVVGNTLIPKSTNSVHSIRVKEINDAINYLKEKIDFNLETTTFEEVEDYLKQKDANPIWLKRMRATLKDRDITKEAFKELNKNNPDINYLADLMNQHQAYLRDDFEVSVEKIEKMIKAGIEAGALGGKLTGAGMGGSIIMIAPGKQEEVADALTKAGGQGYVVKIDEGVRAKRI